MITNKNTIYDKTLFPYSHLEKKTSKIKKKEREKNPQRASIRKGSDDVINGFRFKPIKNVRSARELVQTGEQKCSGYYKMFNNDTLFFVPFVV